MNKKHIALIMFLVSMLLSMIPFYCYYQYVQVVVSDDNPQSAVQDHTKSVLADVERTKQIDYYTKQLLWAQTPARVFWRALGIRSVCLVGYWSCTEARILNDGQDEDWLQYQQKHPALFTFRVFALNSVFWLILQLSIAIGIKAVSKVCQYRKP